MLVNILAELLNLMAVLSFVAIVATTTRRRKRSSTAVVSRPNTSRPKRRNEHLMVRTNKLIKELADLHWDKLRPWIATIKRSDACMKKLNMMHIKVQLVHLDKNQQCKKSIVHLDNHDAGKLDGNRWNPPAIVKKSLSISNSDIQIARVLRSKIDKSRRGPKGCRPHQRSVACQAFPHPYKILKTTSKCIQVFVEFLVNHLDSARYTGIEMYKLCRDIDLSALMRSKWDAIAQSIDIRVLTEDGETTVIIDPFVSFEPPTMIEDTNKAPSRKLSYRPIAY